VNPSFRICLVEDDPIMGESLCDRFELEGFRFDWCKDASSAFRNLATHAYSAVVSDIRLPDASGEDLFRRVIDRDRFVPPWIFITAYGSIDRAVALLKLGAADYITKPFDLDDLIRKLVTVSRVTWRQASQDVKAPSALGVAGPMREIEGMLPRLSAQANTILLTGESGAGKEVVARAIHDRDVRTREHPFIAVNCGALPESLLEAELFGHERGAFTGAVRMRRGVFEQAHKGTLLLDEIGDMPASMQVRLLRTLQERSIVRIGAETAIPVELRLICATHRDLAQMVEQGIFRKDLYYRINVIHVRVPPLRERPEDIMWLAQRFLADQSAQRPGEKKALSRAAERVLMTYPWPGNARELRHCIERAWILTEGPVLEPEAMFEEASLRQVASFRSGDSLNDYLQACEKTYLMRALERHEGQITATASDLGISRKNLWETMRKLGIDSRQRVA
jgi:two-component system, NtrC family, response regulator AtoC